METNKIIQKAIEKEKAMAKGKELMGSVMDAFFLVTKKSRGLDQR